MDESAVTFFRRGEFTRADSILRSIGKGRPGPETQLLRAETFERLGKREDAQRIVHALLRDTALAPDLRCRSLNLIGNIEFENGNVIDATRIFREAAALAKERRCLEQLCWSELRLVWSVLEGVSSDAAIALVPDLRKHVAQSADPLLAIALHVLVSELEAKRGAFTSSEKHVRVARALLEQHENRWLEGLCHLAETAVRYLRFELDAAHQAAMAAVRSALESGHERTRLAANNNLAHIYIARDDLERADRAVTEAQRVAHVSPRCRESLAHTVAELELRKNNIEQSKELIARLLGTSSPDVSYHKVLAHHTLTRCLTAAGQWVEAARIVNRGLKLAADVGNSELVQQFSLLQAEVHAWLGDSTGAVSGVVNALRNQRDIHLEMLGEAERVIARISDREGDHEGAAASFDRSHRIFAAIGHIRAERHVEKQRKQESLDRHSLNSARTARPDLLLQRMAGLVQQASRPDLLGAEAMDLLLDAGVASRAAVVKKTDAKPLTVDRAVGWTSAEARAAAPELSETTLPLGTWRDAEWQLVAEVPQTVAARVAWLAVHTVLSAGIELAAHRRDAREREALWPIDNPDEPSPGVFGSEQMVELLRIAKRIATTDVTVLVTGETGAGKEVLARVLHDASPRAAKPFVPLNCSAVPRDMLEAQLFGHRKGAFTGADTAFPGVFRAAAGGTVFLDEIGDVSLDLQPKLLRFLESGEVHPLGEPQPVRCDVRVVAATNQDLEALVRGGRFREDLWYRLNVIHLKVPPLRERREEIPLLVSHFLERFTREFQKGRLRLAEETMEYFVLHAWPGNVRQLANELRRLAALAEPDAVLMPEHLSPALIAGRRTRPVSERELAPTELVVRLDQPLAAATEHLERAMIQHAMALCQGRVDQVARTLGLSRKGLYLKRQRLKLDPVAS